MTASTADPLVRRVRGLAIPRVHRESALIELVLAERFADDAVELGHVLAGSLTALLRIRQGSPR